MRFRTPLHHVRGLGSAKDGTHHWWMQRLSAVALIPLSLWFVVVLLRVSTQDYAHVVNWIQSPMVSLLLVVLVVALFYHAQLGLQVVVEDYVQSKFIKIASLVLMKLLALALGAGGVFAILRIAFASGA